VIPDNKWITTVVGGDGYQKNVRIIGPHNFAFSVSGPIDTALQIPTGNFNANANMATNVTKFTATGSTYTQTVNTRNSQQIVAFRCVPVNAP